jgi:hypothetical protein
MVGNQFMKLLTARGGCCVKIGIQRFSSLRVSKNPAQVLVLVWSCSVSSPIREYANDLSSAVSYHALQGLFGKIKADAIQMTNVIIPERINDERQPDRSATPLIWKTPIAMRPANAVPQMFAVRIENKTRRSDPSCDHIFRQSGRASRRPHIEHPGLHGI